MVRKLSLACALTLLFAMGGSAASLSEGLTKRHAVSLIGTPKFGPDFANFDWVNPNAAKGGRARRWVLGTFDSLNPFPVKGNPAVGLQLIYDTLMMQSPDEDGASYGLIAEWVAYPDDFSSAIVQLRPEARFNDGTPVTPEDVIFSLQSLKTVSPQVAFYYKDVDKAEKTGPNQVTFTFKVKGNRELPIIIGDLRVLPKHYYETVGANGEVRDLSKSTLEAPLGSGPYRIKEVDPGRSIAYERVKDWWAKDLPVAKGQWNIDELKFVYYRDRAPAFEAFKSGELDYWFESSAKDWATAYDFDAVTRGLIRREKLPIKTVAPMQAFAFNTRRPQFADPRVRHAFNLAFDFEWTNKNLFYDQYVRVGSYFDNSELKATGLPTGRELEILNEVRDEVPPEVFTKEWKNPVNNTPEDVRRHLAEAAKLLAEAGWKPKDGVLTNAQGVELSAEFLLVQPDFDRIVLPYKAVLEKLGIRASVRIVDTSQYQRREDTFDFDIIVTTFQQSESPGNEQREFWGSEAADKEGSRNVIGIKNPAVDKLIDRIILAKNRDDLVAATHALDRVLLWNHYVVPQYHMPFERMAMWDMYRRPEKLPSHGGSFPRVWWYDEAAAKRLADLRG
jgi:microcin C transport system substrate-binding protein